MSKIETTFLKSTSFTKSVPLQSRIIWRERRTSRRIIHTFVSKTVSQYLAGSIFCTQLNFEFEETPLLFPLRLISLEWKEKIKFGDTVLVSNYVAILLPNLSYNGWKLAERELKMCPQFLEKLVSRKKPKYDLKTFSGLRRLKHLGVRIITCGWQRGGSTYLTTIAQTCRQVWCQILRVFMLESDFRWVRVPFKGSSNAINGNFKVIISHRL